MILRHRSASQFRFLKFHVHSVSGPILYKITIDGHIQLYYYWNVYRKCVDHLLAKLFDRITKMVNEETKPTMAKKANLPFILVNETSCNLEIVYRESKGCLDAYDSLLVVGFHCVLTTKALSQILESRWKTPISKISSNEFKRTKVHPLRNDSPSLSF